MQKIGKRKYLEEISDVSIGRTPPRQERRWFNMSGQGVKWISIKDMGDMDGPYIFDTSEYLIREAVEEFRIPIIHRDTVVVSFKMTVGRLAITTEDMVSNEAIAQFRLRDGFNFNTNFLYMTLKNFNFGSLGSTSSIVTAVNSKSIKSIKIKLPDDATFNLLSLKLSIYFLSNENFAGI